MACSSTSWCAGAGPRSRARLDSIIFVPHGQQTGLPVCSAGAAFQRCACAVPMPPAGCRAREHCGDLLRARGGPCKGWPGDPGRRAVPHHPAVAMGITGVLRRTVSGLSGPGPRHQHGGGVLCAVGRCAALPQLWPDSCLCSASCRLVLATDPGKPYIFCLPHSRGPPSLVIDDLRCFHFVLDKIHGKTSGGKLYPELPAWMDVMLLVMACLLMLDIFLISIRISAVFKVARRLLTVSGSQQQALVACADVRRAAGASGWPEASSTSLRRVRAQRQQCGVSFCLQASPQQQPEVQPPPPPPPPPQQQQQQQQAAITFAMLTVFAYMRGRTPVDRTRVHPLGITAVARERVRRPSSLPTSGGGASGGSSAPVKASHEIHAHEAKARCQRVTCQRPPALCLRADYVRYVECTAAQQGPCRVLLAGGPGPGLGSGRPGAARVARRPRQ